jgi:hypothetical protein
MLLQFIITLHFITHATERKNDPSQWDTLAHRQDHMLYKTGTMIMAHRQDHMLYKTGTMIMAHRQDHILYKTGTMIMEEQQLHQNDSLGFVVNTAALGQVFSEYSGSPAIHRLLRTPHSSSSIIRG